MKPTRLPLVVARLSLVWIAAAGALVGAACGSSDPPPAPVEPDGGPAIDAPSSPRDLVGREATPPYERPLPAPEPTGHRWAAKDVGPVSAPNRAINLRMSQLAVARVTAGGTGIGGTADSFGFVSQRARGTVDMLARIRTLQMVDPASTGGLMIRADDTDPAAAGVFVGPVGDPTKPGQVIVRRTRGGAAEVVAADTLTRLNQFLRIRREGGKVTVWRAANVQLSGWAKLGTFDVDLPDEVSVGMAATARSAAAMTVAEFDNARVFAADAAAVTQGWDLENMGSFFAVASLAGGELNVVANGDPFTTIIEQGAPVMTPVSGTHTLVAKVETLGAQNTPRARVALTFREGRPWLLSANPTARHALISVNAMGQVAFQKRDATTNFDPGMVREGMRAPLWLRLVRVDDPVTFRTRVTGSYSADGRTWTDLDSMEIPLADPVMAGVLFTSGDIRTWAPLRLTGLALTPGMAP